MLLTTDQIAEVYDVHRDTIYRWRKAGMPFKKLGTRTFRYDLEEVKTWRAEQRNKNKE